MVPVKDLVGGQISFISIEHLLWLYVYISITYYAFSSMFKGMESSRRISVVHEYLRDERLPATHANYTLISAE